MKKFLTALILFTIIFSTVNAQSLVVSPQEINISFCQGTDDMPVSPMLNIYNGTGSGAINWTAISNQFWLELTQTSGYAEYSSVGYNLTTTDFSPGGYTATITVESPDVTNSPQYINVNLNVSPPCNSQDQLGVSPLSMTFDVCQGEALPVSQYLNIYNASASQAINWSVDISDSTSWLGVSPSTGYSSNNLSQVYLTTTNLDVGNYNLTLFVFSPDVSNSPQYVDVTLNVTAPCSQTYNCGDMNNDGRFVDISDLTFLIDYMFRQAPEPEYLMSADCNGSGGIDISDLTYFIDYMFRGGPPPICENK